MGSLDDLAKRFRERGDEITVNVNKHTRKIALSIDRSLVLAMPVDTGRAKSSVLVTVGEPSFVETTEAYYPGKKGSTAGANAQAAIDQAEHALASREYGQEIHININIPYIGALNEGHSPLADPGFIQQSVINGVSNVTRESILDKNDD